jgi:hypothetical protein
MENTFTLKHMARSSFLALVLMMTFTMSGYSQMYIRGNVTADPEWGTAYEMTARNIDGSGTSSYTHLHQATFTGKHEWKYVSTMDWSGSQWSMQSSEPEAYLNNLQTWTFYGDDNAKTNLTEGKFYTFIFKAVDGANSEGYIFETSAEPVTITNVSEPSIISNVDDAVITVTASSALTDEKVYIFYTTNGQFPNVMEVAFSGNTGTAIIPAQSIGTLVSYYAFTSCVPNIYEVSDYDLATLNYNNNNGANYSYTIVDPDGAPLAVFSPANNATEVLVNVNPTITFDKDVKKAVDGSDFTADEDVTYLLEFYETSTPENAVAFSASINGREITVVPNAVLDNSTTYTITLAAGSVENASGSENDMVSSSFTTAAPSVDVTFTVDMNYEVYVNGWDPVNGNVEIRGSWDQNWAAPIAMTDVDGDNVFEGILTNRPVGEDIHYKFVKNGVDWETIENRLFSVDLSAPVASLAYFNNNILPVESDILSFTMAEQASAAIINSEDKTITLEVVYGTNLTELTPTFTLSYGAKADVTSGVARDFSSEVTYSITPYDNSAATDWIVNVTAVSAPLTGNDITSFSFAEQTGEATIDTEAGTVSIEIAYDADITNLTPTITISAGATIDPPTSPADFSDPVVYTVTAQDESQKLWTVTVTIQETLNVSLNVNMNKQFNLGAFDPATDGVLIAGNFNDWSGEAIFDEESDLVYTFTKAVPVGYVFEFKFQMLKDESANWENMADNRFYTVIEGINADTVWFNNTPFNTDATLSSITVNGNEISNFDPTQLQYVFPMPEGSDIPEVLGTVNDEYAEAFTTQASAHPGSATILVIAEDRTELTYTVDLVVGPSNIATLSDLTVDGETIDEFESTKFEYWVMVPYGTTDVPEVDGTLTDINAGITITQAESVNGDVASIHVLAEDGIAENTYKVNFMVAPNHDATLSSLELDYVLWDEFNTNQLVYIMPLAEGSYPPQITGGTPTDPNAVIIGIQNAYTVPGTAIITVMAENYTDELTYKINFTSEAASTDATLSDLTVDGVTVDEFTADLFSYSVELPYGTTSVEVLGTATDVNAQVENTQATEFPGAATVKVTAEDGVTELTYTVNFTIAPNTDATLSDLTVDGVTVDGFTADLFSYSVELPYGTTSVEVLGTATDVNAQVENTQATEFPGAATVKVTAEDGATELTYTVNFTIATGINNTESIISNVYPNPTKGVVTIQLSNLNTETQLRVTDISGRVIMVKSLSQLETQVDLSSNKPGIYIISVSNSDKLYYTRIILQ